MTKEEAIKILVDAKAYLWETYAKPVGGMFNDRDISEAYWILDDAKRKVNKHEHGVLYVAQDFDAPMEIVTAKMKKLMEE